MKSQSRLQEIDRRLDRIYASQSQKHKIKAEIKERFGGNCTYCGCIPRFLTLNHVIPQTQGGLNVRSNLAAVCQRCNRSKGIGHGGRHLLAGMRREPFVLPKPS